MYFIKKFFYAPIDFNANNISVLSIICKSVFTNDDYFLT